MLDKLNEIINNTLRLETEYSEKYSTEIAYTISDFEEDFDTFYDLFE